MTAISIVKPPFRIAITSPGIREDSSVDLTVFSILTMEIYCNLSVLLCVSVERWKWQVLIKKTARNIVEVSKPENLDDKCYNLTSRVPVPSIEDTSPKSISFDIVLVRIYSQKCMHFVCEGLSGRGEVNGRWGGEGETTAFLAWVSAYLESGQPSSTGPILFTVSVTSNKRPTSI